MDLMRRVTTRLSRWAYARPSVLMVDPPGTTKLRWHVEAGTERRAWPTATTPADADLMLVLGEPGPELTAAADVLWSQVPRPRARWSVRVDDDIDAELDAAAAAVTDSPPRGDTGTEDPAELLGDGQDDEMAGLPMAGTAPDRDGLELDSLRVSLGPILPAWPTGLVLDGSLQGDVLSGVSFRWLDGAALPAPEDDLPARVVALDQLARFLDVAGWPAPALQARRARRELVSGDPHVTGRGRRRAERCARQVRRSLTLSWSVGDIGGGRHRIRRWCDLASGHDGPGLPGNGGMTGPTPGSGAPEDLTGLVAVLEGVELATARMIMASVDAERLRVPARPSTEHGAADG